MGYFDGLVDASFKKDSSGKNLYYPWGTLASGYIIESDEEQKRIRNIYKKSYMVILPLIIIGQVVAGFWLNVILCPFYMGWFYYLAKRECRNLSKTTEKLTRAEAHANSARSQNLPTLILLTMFSILFVGFGLFSMYRGTASFVVVASVVFFGLCGIGTGYQITVKVRSRKDS